MPLGNNLRTYRLARGLSLGQLAEAVGMDRGYLSRIEREKCGCSDVTKLILANYFGVPVTKLFFQPSSVDTGATNLVVGASA